MGGKNAIVLTTTPNLNPKERDRQKYKCNIYSIIPMSIVAPT